MKYVRLNLLVSVILSFSIISAQGTWKVFTKSDGLSSNRIIDILEDSKGNIWFNTGNNGVMKYNGTSWTKYSTNNGLLSNKHLIMHKHSDGTILIGDYKGIVRHNGSTFEVITKKYGTDHIIEDLSGNIWFGTSNVSCYYDGEKINRITKKGGNIPSTILTYYYYDKKNDTMWFGGRKGLSSFDGENWRIYKYGGAPSTQVTTITTDDDGVVWVGTNIGIYSYNGKEWSRYSIENGLITDDILLLHKDKMNRIWAISGKKPVMPGLASGVLAALSKSGLQLYNDGKWNGFTDEPGIPGGKVAKLYEASNGDLWFDTDETGFYRYDGNSWVEYSKNSGFRANNFGAIYEDSNGNIWIGIGRIRGHGIGMFDGAGWMFYNKESGLPSDMILSIFEDSNGNMWFGTGKGIVKYTP